MPKINREKIKQATGYQTTDGTIHEDILKAKRHQIRIDVGVWYSENYLTDGDEDKIDLLTILEWIKENQEAIRLILNEIECLT